MNLLSITWEFRKYIFYYFAELGHIYFNSKANKNNKKNNNFKNTDKIEREREREREREKLSQIQIGVKAD